MRKKIAPPPPSVEERISAARVKLDRLGDRANELITAFEAKLSDLRPGVGHSMEMDVEGARWVISYARGKDRDWRLFAQSNSSVAVTLCSAPRLVRLTFLEQTDTFLESIATRMEEILERHRERVE